MYMYLVYALVIVKNILVNFLILIKNLTILSPVECNANLIFIFIYILNKYFFKDKNA